MFLKQIKFSMTLFISIFLLTIFCIISISIPIINNLHNVLLKGANQELILISKLREEKTLQLLSTLKTETFILSVNKTMSFALDNPMFVAGAGNVFEALQNRNDIIKTNILLNEQFDIEQETNKINKTNINIDIKVILNEYKARNNIEDNLILNNKKYIIAIYPVIFEENSEKITKGYVLSFVDINDILIILKKDLPQTINFYLDDNQSLINKKNMLFISSQIKMLSLKIPYIISINKIIALEEVNNSIKNIFLYSVIITIISLLLATVIIKILIKPVSYISEIATKYSNREYEQNVKPSKFKEFNDIINILKYLGVTIIEHINEHGEKIRMQTELETVRIVQQTLLPLKNSDSIKNLIWKSHYLSAAECGGDWFGLYNLGTTNRIVIFVGDVTGHGSPAAMTTALVKGFCEQLKYYNSDSFSLSDFIGMLNKLIFETAGEQRLMTMCAFDLNLDTGKLIFVNAGHNFPLLIESVENKDINCESVELSTLLLRGNRLGFNKEAVFLSKIINLKPDSILFVYTDGLIENKNYKGEEFKEKNLRKNLSNKGILGVDNIVDIIKSAYDAHVGNEKPNDDVTYLAFQWKK